MFNSLAVPHSKRASLFLLSLTFVCLLFAQYTSAQTVKTDLDRLYEKYKGTSETTIFVGDKEISARVLINYNAKHQPYRIIIYGDAAADTNLEELVSQLGEAKTKAGYKRLQQAGAVNFDQNRVYENNIQVALYQKGTQYAKYGIKKMDERNQLVGDTENPHHTTDFFYFEVGDAARKNTVKPEKFDF
jgi:hypothetical protein